MTALNALKELLSTMLSLVAFLGLCWFIGFMSKAGWLLFRFGWRSL